MGTAVFSSVFWIFNFLAITAQCQAGYFTGSGWTAEARQRLLPSRAPGQEKEGDQN